MAKVKIQFNCGICDAKQAASITKPKPFQGSTFSHACLECGCGFFLKATLVTGQQGSVGLAVLETHLSPTAKKLIAQAEDEFFEKAKADPELSKKLRINGQPLPPPLDAYQQAKEDCKNEQC